jgi:GAF domain-containing protein
MTDQSDLRAAVAAGVVGSEESHRALLNAIVEVARSIFGAKASSILLLDEKTEELVFEAVVGEGEDTLLGTRFPAGTGIAGWVLATRTPLVIEDVHNDPRWSRDVAEGTGYVPKGLMAAPLLHEEGALGVLSVLDRPEQTLFTLQEMELLGLFANQAAIAVDLLLKAREAERLLGSAGGELDLVARLATAVDALEDERREAGVRLLRDLTEAFGAYRREAGRRTPPGLALELLGGKLLGDCLVAAKVSRPLEEVRLDVVVAGGTEVAEVLRLVGGVRLDVVVAGGTKVAEVLRLVGGVRLDVVVAGGTKVAEVLRLVGGMRLDVVVAGGTKVAEVLRLFE